MKRYDVYKFAPGENAYVLLSQVTAASPEDAAEMIRLRFSLTGAVYVRVWEGRPTPERIASGTSLEILLKPY